MSVQTSKLLEKVLDYTTLKQQVISKNISNVGTKNYKREDVKFEDVLNISMNNKMTATSNKHFSGSEVKTSDAPDYKIEADEQNDGNDSGANNVDMDREMAEMAQNTMLFKFAAQKLRGHYISLQSVIKGR